MPNIDTQIRTALAPIGPVKIVATREFDAGDDAGVLAAELDTTGDLETVAVPVPKAERNLAPGRYRVVLAIVGVE